MDEEMDPIEEVVDEEEELDEDGLPKKIPGLEDEEPVDDDDAM